MKFRILTISLILIFSLPLISMRKNEVIRLPKSIAKEYAFIPMSSTEIDGNNVSVMAFYLSRTEVSNSQYKLFLADLKARGRESDYLSARIDSTGWDIPYSYCEPFKTHYHLHPAYNNYPVVNISHAGALLYCKWLEDKLNSENPGIRYHVRLPQRAELIAAGRCGNPSRPYAWEGNTLSDKEGKQNCNFWLIGQESIHRNPSTKAIEFAGPAPSSIYQYFMVAPCSAFKPNEWGVQNICGNVAEMTADEHIAVGGSWYSTGYDVRISSIDSIQKPNPMTGFRPLITMYSPKV